MQGGSLDKHISGIPLFAENFHVCKWFSSFKILSVLFSIVDESCDLDSPTNYKIIRGICEGLNHLHTAKGKPICHLDLKPSNILLDKNKTAKIGDLGLSNLVASTETHRTEVVKGTQ
jgi:serine/threonine protein kinase